MERILDFSVDLDVALFDNVVSCAYLSKNSSEQRLALEILTKFRENPESWKRVDLIL
ncbi:Exportin-1, partial [Nowakowskiella sp. JEL0078]